MQSIAELEERLSRPTPGVIEDLTGLEGDLLVLGAGGKMGPSLARMARRALDASGNPGAVIAVSRFSSPQIRGQLEDSNVRTIACDLLDRGALDALPDPAAVFFLAGMKFGTSDAAALTWAMNAWLPALVAERFAGVPTVVFSSGNVYPFVPVECGGASEDTPPEPIGEYGWSVLARERIFEHASHRWETPVLLLRLNYAAELRYGVPADVARKVAEGLPIDLAMGHVNLIWQGDANALALRSLHLASSPPFILNVTGPETISIRELAIAFGKKLGKEPVFAGREEPTALLSDASQSIHLFGRPTMPLDELIEAIADWIRHGSPSLERPTHYEIRDGRF